LVILYSRHEPVCEHPARKKKSPRLERAEALLQREADDLKQ
jgi:hypothetical protein